MAQFSSVRQMPFSFSVDPSCCWLIFVRVREAMTDSFYKDGEMRHLPMVAYPHTKAKIQCWAIIIWYADRGPEYEQLTWSELAKRFAYFYKRQLNENMHPQSIRFLGEKLGA
jgi:hypothetical protein